MRLFWSRDAFSASAWSGLIAEYRWTFLVETGVMISQLCVYKAASRWLGQEGFSEYAVARRTIALIYPLTLLGFTVALPRFIARTKDNCHPEHSKGYFGAALLCILCTMGLWAGTANLLPGPLALVFFGKSDFSYLIRPLSLMVCGLTLHTVTYAYFRGNMAMKVANILQFINLGLLPPFVFLIQRKNVGTILLELGGLTLLVSGTVIVAMTPWPELITVQRWRIRELVGYGLQRLPGDACLLGLLTLPVTITAHTRNVERAGLVAFGTLFLTIMAAMISPMGLILLPKASRMFTAGAFLELKEHLWRLAAITVVLTGSVSIMVALLAHPLVRVYLGPGFDDAAGVLRLVVLGAVPYCLFLLLSHVIDAFHRTSVTAGIEIIAFAVACLACGVGWFNGRSSSGVLLAFIAGLFTLAILSGIVCVRIFQNTRLQPEEVIAEAAMVQPGE